MLTTRSAGFAAPPKPHVNGSLDALALEDLGHRDAERAALERREIAGDSLVHRRATRVVLNVELEGEGSIVARHALPRMMRKVRPARRTFSRLLVT